jgi:hypothetical protein
MIVIKFIEPDELPATCAECLRFVEELCNQFPAVYDVERGGYLCKECADFRAPALSATLAVVCTGVLYAYYEATGSPDSAEQLDLLRYGCANLLDTHFAPVFGQPEPDYYLTSQAEQ